MTEVEAQEWLASQGWWSGKEKQLLSHLVELVLAEADRQNLISASSREHIWGRHIADSAQLLALPVVKNAVQNAGSWIDLGTGAGFPGLVVACLLELPMRLVEVRPLRASFLTHCAETLRLSHVEIVASKVERATAQSPAGMISARAYAPLDRLLESACHLSDENTVWVLPKGRQGKKELEIIQRDWQAVFHVEQSITDTESVIVTIEKLHRRSAATPARSGGRPARQRSRR